MVTSCTLSRNWRTMIKEHWRLFRRSGVILQEQSPHWDGHQVCIYSPVAYVVESKNWSGMLMNDITIKEIRGQELRYTGDGETWGSLKFGYVSLLPSPIMSLSWMKILLKPIWITRWPWVWTILFPLKEKIIQVFNQAPNGSIGIPLLHNVTISYDREQEYNLFSHSYKSLDNSIYNLKLEYILSSDNDHLGKTKVCPCLQAEFYRSNPYVFWPITHGIPVLPLGSFKENEDGDGIFLFPFLSVGTCYECNWWPSQILLSSKKSVMMKVMDLVKVIRKYCVCLLFDV